jgi:hypothetical protein
MPNNRPHTTRSADTAGPTEAVIDAVVAFERARRERNRAKRVKPITCGAVLLMTIAGSPSVSEVNLARLISAGAFALQEPIARKSCVSPSCPKSCP